MIYTRRYICTVSLIMSCTIYILIYSISFKIKNNLIKFEEYQTSSFINPIDNYNKKNDLDINKISNLKTNEMKISENEKKQTNTNWRIKIPIINVDAPISEGVDDEVIAKTVGHFEESDKWNGNVALAAHNRGYDCNYFQDIKRLKKGDIITYSTERGEKNYIVETNIVIKETDWSYVKNTNDNRITLITCEEDKREFRRCIQGIEI